MSRILIADDNIEIRAALRLFLETRLNLEAITEAGDMEHVLAQVEDFPPDCIILDWELPGRPNSKRISVLRTLLPSLKVIAVNTRPELRQQVMDEGADAFVCRTDPTDRLLAAMYSLCL